jgi:hypothetical protein
MRHALYQTGQERPVKAFVETSTVAVIATPQDNVPVPLDMDVGPARRSTVIGIELDSAGSGPATKA